MSVKHVTAHKARIQQAFPNVTGVFREFAVKLLLLMPEDADERAVSLTLTKLEECLYWSGRAVRPDGFYEPSDLDKGCLPQEFK
jgi:hypothetical protein